MRALYVHNFESGRLAPSSPSVPARPSTPARSFACLACLPTCSGSLPKLWGYPTAFPLLQEIHLANNSLHGPLPSVTAALHYKSLRIIDLSYNNFGGTLPAEYGAPGATPSAQIM